MESLYCIGSVFCSFVFEVIIVSLINDVLKQLDESSDRQKTDNNAKLCGKKLLVESDLEWDIVEQKR